MKRIIYLVLSLALVFINAQGEVEKPVDSIADSIIVLTTHDLKELVSDWAAGYINSVPGSAIRIKIVSDNTSDQKPKAGEIIFADERSAQFERSGDNDFRIIVGRDIIIPVISSANPFMEDILSKGVSAENIKKIITGAQVKWSDILNVRQDGTIKFNYPDDPAVLNAIKALTGIDPGKTSGKKFSSVKEMFSEMSIDKFSVGFCKLSDIQDDSGKYGTLKISLMPLDKNSNGKIDSNEDIYTDVASFERGVWIGKYPRDLYNNIFSITGTPVSENVSSFLNWLIADGQKSLTAAGHSGLILTERLSVAGKLSTAMVRPESYNVSRGIFRALVIGALILAIITILIIMVRRFLRKMPVVPVIASKSEGPALDERLVMLPKGLYFDKTHTWAYLEQDGRVKVGVDDFLLHVTGLVSRVKMKKPGEKVKKGDEILSVVNNGKQLHLYSPVSGVIREINTGLESKVDLLNSAPYTKGWVYLVEPENWQRENQLLFMADKHMQFIQNEIVRIKDFLASLLQDGNLQCSPIILQDGGMLRQGVLSELGPEVWEEFQTRIIDPSRTVWFYEII